IKAEAKNIKGKIIINVLFITSPFNNHYRSKVLKRCLLTVLSLLCYMGISIKENFESGFFRNKRNVSEGKEIIKQLKIKNETRYLKHLISS
ncbi:hypothetical protein, partial [Staphylococcus condimenti]|uniref:hypothetical protein n=1 Tax=Staphylococcus condimenti TaxID=70255 RepID=UPI001A9281DE